MTDADIGARYVDALARKDTAALEEIFTPDVSFRGMTPGRFWEAGTPAEVAVVLLGNWFEPGDVVESVDQVESGAIVDRPRVDYRFRVRNLDGVFAVEQRAYFDVDDDGLVHQMHVVCAAFRKVLE